MWKEEEDPRFGNQIDLNSNELRYEGDQTLLALAILNGSYEVVKYLASIGADLTTKDSDNNSYLHIAAIAGHLNIFIFFAQKLSLSAKNKHEFEPLDIARAQGYTHIVDFMNSL